MTLDFKDSSVAVLKSMVGKTGQAHGQQLGAAVPQSSRRGLAPPQ